MIGETAVAIGVIDTIGLLALIRIYFLIKKDTEEKLDKFDGRVSKLEDTTVTKKDFDEILGLKLEPVAIQLKNINKRLNDVTITKIKQ